MLKPEDTSGADTIPAEDAPTADQNQAAAFQRMKTENAEMKAKLDVQAPATSAEEDEPKDVETIVEQALAKQLLNASEVSKIMTKYPSLNTEENATKVAEYLKDSTRKDVPIDEVVAGAIGIDKLISAGASIGGEALDAAAESTSGGGDGTTKPKTDEQKTEQNYVDSLPGFAT